MRPLYLKVRGSKGFRAGMGVDEVEIDFTKLPAGLIAIVGPNGMGKTTLFDLLGPFRVMGYKLKDSDSWAPKAFERAGGYYRQFFGRDSMIERHWEMGGIIYKTLILIDAEKRSTECYLYIQSADGVWVPQSDAVKDGKCAPFDEAIESIVGSPSMFYTSVCRPQKAKDITSYSRADIMTVIIELLNLEPIRLQGEKSKEVIKALEAIVQSIEISKAPILQSLEGRQALLDSRGNHESALRESDVLTGILSDSLATAENRVHEIELAAASETVSRRRLEEMGDREKDLAKQIADINLETTNRWTGLQSDIKAVGQETADLNLAATRDIGNIELKIETAQVVINRADEIRAAVDQAEVLTGQLATARNDKENCTERYRALADKSKLATAGKAGIDAARLEVKSEEERRQTRTGELGRENERCSLQAKTLAAGLDCKADGSNWINDACPLLQDAVKAKSRLAEITAEAAELWDPEASINGRLSLAKLKDTVNDLDSAWQAKFATVEADLKACVEEGQKAALSITTLEADLKKVQETANLVFDLETAEERVKELTEQADAKKLERDQRLALLNVRSQELAVKLQECVAEADLRITGIQEKLTALTEEIAVLRNTLNGDKDTELATAQATIAETKKKIADMEESVRKTHSDLGAVAAQLEDLDRKESSLTVFDERISQIDTEMIAWKVLAKACGNDGILNLEIEDSGPSVSAKANDLLSSYGPRFSVRIETQTEKADGNIKNVFDITVFDSERDEEKSITDMSGGEVTIIEDAVVRGFNLFNLHKGTRHFAAVYSDEKDGALSMERKLELFAVKQMSLKIGNHEREFFITQTPELWELADACIILGKGGITISQ